MKQNRRPNRSGGNLQPVIRVRLKGPAAVKPTLLQFEGVLAGGTTKSEVLLPKKHVEFSGN